MIFPNLLVDSIVQQQDLFRFDARGSVVSGEEITKVEIKPSGDDDYLEVDTIDMFLDWAYDEAGEKLASLKITTENNVKEITKTITCKTALEEKLFSNDESLLHDEEVIMRKLPAGRASFVYLHRKAQDEIIKELREMNIDITVDQIFNRADVEKWSRYKVFKKIFGSNVMLTDDIDIEKRNFYSNLEKGAKADVRISLDKNQDGKEDGEVKTRITGLRLV